MAERQEARDLSEDVGQRPVTSGEDAGVTASDLGSDTGTRSAKERSYNSEVRGFTVAMGVECGTESDESCGQATVNGTSELRKDPAFDPTWNGARDDAYGNAGVSKPHWGSQDSSTEQEYDPTNYKKVFVGNIGYQQNWWNLKDFFSKFGKVVYAQIVFDHIKQRSRGIGFVEFSSEEDALNCLIASDKGLILEGRKLRVNYATESQKVTFTKYPRVPSIPHYEPAEGKEDKSVILNADEWAVIFKYLTVPEQIRLERVCKRWRDMALQVWMRRTSLTCTGFAFSMCGFSVVQTDKTLNSVLSRCGKFLYVLDLGTCTRLLTEYSLTIIGHYCPQLRKLNLEGVAATNTGLRDLSRAAKNLKWLNLHKCPHVSEKGLWWILKNCQQLEYLDISGNTCITGKCFHMVGPHLKILKAGGCLGLTDYCLETLARKCPDVQEVRLSKCRKLTEASVLALMKLSKLEVLDFAHNLSQSALQFEVPWIPLGTLHNLRELRLDYITGITDNVLEAVSIGCPKLRILTLQGCRPGVTHTGLWFLLDLKELSTLDLSYIVEVDDEFLRRLSMAGLLEKLTLRICPHISDQGIQHVLELSPRLQLLDLSGNMTLTLSTLTPLTTTTTLDRPPNQTLRIVIGGTLMIVLDEHEKLSATKSRLPPHVTLQETNWSNPLFDPDQTIMMPLPREEEDEEEDEYAQWMRRKAEAEAAGGNGAQDPVREADKVMYFPPVLDYNPVPVWSPEEDWGLEAESALQAPVAAPFEGNAEQVEENGVALGEAEQVEENGAALGEGAYGPPLPEYNPRLWSPEEDWAAQADAAGAPAPAPVIGPFEDNLGGFYDDFDDDDEDDDEFLVNDDPLEMERWDFS